MRLLLNKIKINTNKKNIKKIETFLDENNCIIFNEIRCNKSTIC